MEIKSKRSVKKIIIIACVASALAVVLVFVLFGLSVSRPERDATFYNSELSFAEADYSKNILEDLFYLRLNRDIMFVEFGDGEPLTAENFTQRGENAEFFYNYFQAVINGDYSLYPSFFSEEYKSSHDLPKRFTMQRLYDINVELYSRDGIDCNGETVMCSRYIVSYRIQYNNGTFRGDISGNECRPLLISLINDNGKVVIHSVTQINYYGA